jgi:hypothetical protein
VSDRGQKIFNRFRGWAASGHAANLTTAIANGALAGDQPWYVVLLHLLLAAVMPSPVAAASKK